MPPRTRVVRFANTTDREKRIVARNAGSIFSGLQRRNSFHERMREATNFANQDTASRQSALSSDSVFHGIAGPIVLHELRSREEPDEATALESESQFQPARLRSWFQEYSLLDVILVAMLDDLDFASVLVNRLYDAQSMAFQFRAEFQRE